jgi:hypothetical protein
MLVRQMQSQGYLKETTQLICTDEGLRIADRLTLELISRGTGISNQLAVISK